MKKRLSIIGLALLAALALSAVAGAAGASASQFRAQQYPATITGTQGATQKLVLNGTTIKCNNPTGTATASAASSTLALSPSYSGCTLGGLNANFVSNGCQLIYTSISESAPLTGTLGVSCEAGAAIEIKQGTCVVSIPTQSGVGGVEFTNAGTGSTRTITATYNITALSYSGGSGCPASLKGSYSNGTLTGGTVFKGSVGLRQIGVYVDNAQVEDAPRFQSGTYPAIVQSSSPSAFLITLNGTTIKCNYAVATSKLASAAPELRQEMGFAGCSAGGIAFTLSATGCTFNDYVEGGSFSGGRELACSPGQEMTLTWGTCVIKFPSQNMAGSVAYTNGESGGVKNVGVGFSASGVKYTGGAGCATSIQGSHADGALANSWTLKSYADAGGNMGAQSNLWIQ
ncbi:MAG TPA: hypothetical protein VFU16_07155 [Solirubrobacterales bacterium]|nr:hypothetical protein [Solirubrobacterales bacterium]